MIWHFQNKRIINVLGTEILSPSFPAYSASDWDEQPERWHGPASHLFNRD
jgi:hypothetical protein